MKNNIFSKSKSLFILGFLFLTIACNEKNNSLKQEATTTQKTTNTSLENMSKERLEELRNAAKESKNVNLSDVFVKRGVELAAKYCKCGEQKNTQAQNNCRSRLEQTYRTIDSRLEEARKTVFAKAYSEGKKACK